MPELMSLMEDWKGYFALSEIKKPEGYEQKLKETVDLIYNSDGMPPHKHEFMIREALTTSDFPYLFGDVLDRQVLAAYKAVEPVWKAFCRRGTVKRIYPQAGGYRFAITGGDQYLAEVGEKGEYLASERDETKDTVYVKKYGRQFDISWEAIINDDLGALQDTPQRFARAAVRTEHRLVTTAYANDLGTHAAGNIYDNATANQINAANVALSIANLENAYEAMMAFVDGNGEPIVNMPKYLVVPPALKFTAQQILTSANKMWLSDSDDVTPPAAYPMTNVIAQAGLTLIVDPYLAVINADTYPNSWYLFADPGDIAAIEYDYLAGHERPEICMKASDKVSLGGGPIGPMDGDFATDNIFYRVRDVFGANKLVTTGGWRATYMGYSA
jgi:hypothetical protein